MTLLRRIEDLIDGFQPADGPPPQTLGAFLRWCLRGSMPVLWVAAAFSALAGTLEVISATLLGLVIDTALSAGPEGFFTSQWSMVLWFAAFFILIRPVVFGLSSAANAIVVQPNLNPLVLSRLHRWTMASRSVSLTTTSRVGSRRNRCRPPVQRRM